MDKLIRILKDTPFDKAGTEMAIGLFRARYGYICVKHVSDQELIKYLETEYNMAELYKDSYVNVIGTWFKVIGKFPEQPNQFIHEDLYYVKEFDGTYRAFASPTTYKYYKAGDKTLCLKIVSIPDARKLIAEGEFKQMILYVTNDVNKKL